MLKRFFTIVILFLLLSSTVICASAQAQVIDTEVSKEDLYYTKTVSFDTTKDTGDKETIIKSKLAQAGVPEKYYHLFPEKYIDYIVDADKILTVSSYYVESSLNDGSLIQVTKEKYIDAVKRETEKRNKIEKQVEESLKSGNTATIASDFVIYSPGLEETVDKGTLALLIMLIPGGDNIDFLCAGMFQWHTMPNSRKEDAFGISWGEGVNPIPHEAVGEYETTYTRSGQGESGYETNEFLDIREFDYSDLEKNEKGYAMRIMLYEDSAMTQYPYSSIIYRGITGTVAYQGTVTETNKLSIYHYAVYGHKRWRILPGDGIDFSIPFGAGFSIKFGSKYDNIVEQHLWRR